jgi:DNA polymerase (family 10)
VSHPTGRLDAYALDLERLIEGAAERGCWLECNAQPQRLDLSDTALRAALRSGWKGSAPAR